MIEMKTKGLKGDETRFVMGSVKSLTLTSVHLKCGRLSLRRV